MSHQHRLDMPPFETIEDELAEFAESVGGKFSRAPGLSAEEIQLSKSLASKWFDKHVLRLSPDFVPRELETLYRNAYVDFVYDNCAFRFHMRNQGYGFEHSGQFGLRVVSELPGSNLKLKMLPKTKGSPFEIRDVIEVNRPPEFMKILIPEGILGALDDEDKTYRVRFQLTYLEEKYAARASNQQMGSLLFNDHRIQQCLLEMPDIDFLFIGFLDPKIRSHQRCLELVESIGFPIRKPLEATLRFIQACLDVIDKLSAGTS